MRGPRERAIPLIEGIPKSGTAVFSRGVLSMIGTTVSHYKILEKLGEGGMGVVYKAEDTRLKRTVALKFLPHGLEAHQPERDRFLQEARAAAILNHPNICTIHDIAEHEGQQFIVMEYVDGKTLRQKIEDETLKFEDCIKYAIQIGEALQEAHTHGIVHRDIKAENIMVTKNQIKVMDFGLAKLKGSLKLTKTSSTIGTLAYMAPEQIEGGEVDARSDIFSFGVVLYEMLTGHTPFRGEHEAAMVYSIVNEEPTPLQKYLPNVPSELAHILDRALEKDPEDRYQSAHDMVIDLRRLKKDSSRVVRAPAEYRPADATPLAVTGGKRRLSGPARVIAGGAVLVLASIIGWIVFRPGGAPAGRQEAAKSIAVMYFENRTAEKDLDRILVDMLITNLARNKHLSVVSGQRLYDILRSLGKQDSVAIDRTTATEAAKRAGARTMLLGSIWNVGGKLDYTGQLLDVESGAVINSERVEASKAEEIFSVADRLTQKVNEWLSGAPTEALRIGDATTGSYEAYRFYEQGIHHMRRFEFPDALTSFQEAIRLDSTFALAHLQMALVLGELQVFSNRPTANLLRARESAERAERYAANLSERERGMISGSNASLRRDFEEAERIFKRLATAFPDDPEIWFSLSWHPMLRGRLEEAISTLERAIEADRSFANAYNIAGYMYCVVGQYEKGLSAERTYMALIPDAWNAYDSGCDVFIMAGKFDEALKICEEGLKRVPDWTESLLRQADVLMLMHEPVQAREKVAQFEKLEPESMEIAERTKSISYYLEGRMRESADILRSSAERSSSKNSKGVELTSRFCLARILQEQGRFKDASMELETVRSLSREVRKDPLNPWPLVCDFWAGRSLVGKGDCAGAEARASALRSAAGTTLDGQHYLLYYNGLMADIQLSQGKAREAMSSLDKLVPLTRISFAPMRMLDAKVSVELEDRTRAAQLYDGFRNLMWATGTMMGGDPFEFWIEQSKLDYYEGRMYERFGQKTQAISCYQKASHNWQHADRDYPPSVDARERLTNLMK
jgi:tetratricopeptide (TPR) repeat protein/predicted Ser/Thr protein kinase